MKQADTAGPEECWNWKGYRHPEGYGHIRVNGRMTRAHRYAYETFVGPIPEGTIVRHTCDNPTHLLLGTQADNIQDKTLRGRHAKTRRGKKITDDQVREILQLSAEGKTRRAVAQKFGVSPCLVANIVLRKARKAVVMSYDLV